MEGAGDGGGCGSEGDRGGVEGGANGRKIIWLVWSVGVQNVTGPLATITRALTFVVFVLNAAAAKSMLIVTSLIFFRRRIMKINPTALGLAMLVEQLVMEKGWPYQMALDFAGNFFEHRNELPKI